MADFTMDLKEFAASLTEEQQDELLGFLLDGPQQNEEYIPIKIEEYRQLVTGNAILSIINSIIPDTDSYSEATNFISIIKAMLGGLENG